MLDGDRIKRALNPSKGIAGTLARDVGELQANLEREIRRRIRWVTSGVFGGVGSSDGGADVSWGWA